MNGSKANMYDEEMLEMILVNHQILLDTSTIY